MKVSFTRGEDVMSYYEKLRNKVEMEGEIQDFKEVNKCIKDILSDEHEDNEIKIIKSLICHFEGKLNKANYLMTITIGFALVICATSLVGIILDKEKNVIVITILCLFVLGITLYVAYSSIVEKKSGYKDAFILKALNFKLEELIEESKHTEEESVSDKKKETKGKKKSKKSNHRK